MDIITGYKATDKDIKCRGFQFVPGEWHEAEGELVECRNGFHFCDQPSGPWAYYRQAGTRVWLVEAREVLDMSPKPGADVKRVARQIRLVEEVVVGVDGNTGNGNTGDYSTGDGNTGNYNTGDYNTGDGNTGNYSTGDCNTGYYNTGDYNTGDCNTGNCNTGDCNTGNCNTGSHNTGIYNTGRCNTGDENTGNRNTGNCNTGSYNTGNGNATSHSSGFFCQKEAPVLCFDADTGLTQSEFMEKFGDEERELARRLQSDEPIALDEEIANLPNITPEKLASLHAKFIEARKKAVS